jgi:hypothetical protein
MPATVTRWRIVSAKVSDGRASIQTFIVRQSDGDLIVIGAGAALIECLS